MTSMFAGAGQQGTVQLNAAARVSPGTRRLEVSIEEAGSRARVSLHGILDSASAASVYDAIVATAAVPGRRLQMDLSGLDAATRTGCRAIFVAAKLLHGRGGGVTIFGARPNVLRILANAGFDALLEFRDGAVPDEAAAKWARKSGRLHIASAGIPPGLTRDRFAGRGRS